MLLQLELIDASSAGADEAAANVVATSAGDSGGVSNIVVSSESDAVAVGVDASSAGVEMLLLLLLETVEVFQILWCLLNLMCCSWS
jgi:hypothetical protein